MVDPHGSPLERIAVTLGIILFCAIIGAGLAWISPVLDASPTAERIYPALSQEEAMRRLKGDNAAQKLSRAGLGALGGCTFGIIYCVVTKVRARREGTK